MNKRIKNLLIVIAAVVTFILIVFGFGFSETLENIIMYGIGGLTILILIVAMMDEDNKTILTMFGILGIAITAGLIAWSGNNDSARREKEMQERLAKADIEIAKKAREDSIQHIKDSIQYVKDSLQIEEDSKKLYAQEGDTIFGQFYFGMTEQQVSRIKEIINRETRGRISIAGLDFIINNCKYYNNKLYSIQLRSANRWIRYYFHDAYDYDDSENNYGDGHTLVNKIKDSFTRKYGKPNKNDNWHFTHKDILVESRKDDSIREGLLSTQNWAVFITIDNPQITRQVEIEEKEKADKAEEERKAAEEDYKRKKEAFGGGL